MDNPFPRMFFVGETERLPEVMRENALKLAIMATVFAIAE